jgi:predicted aspartyl protease
MAMLIVPEKSVHSLCLFVFFFLFLGCQSTEKARQDDNVKAYGPITIDANASHVIFDVRIGDKMYPFMLDTGSTGTIFDERLRGKLGKTIGYGTLMNTGQRIPIYDAIDAYIGGKNIRTATQLVCFDLSTVSKALNTDILGVVGMSFLKRHRIYLDKANGTVQFEETSTQVHRSWGKGWKMHFRHGWPCVYIDEMKEEFLLDTGDGGSGQLPEELFRKAMQHEGLSPRKCSSSSASGYAERRIIRVFTIRLLGMEYHGLNFAETNKGVLGLEFLARHKVLLDFKGRRMYLKKSKRYHWPDRISWTGMVLGFFRNEIKVLQVVTKSVAEISGIIKGDVIEDIDGIGNDDLTLGSVDRIFDKKDKVTINLIREGQRKTILIISKKRKTEKVK